MTEPASGDDVDATWEQARSTNLANWNDRVPIHVAEYGIEAFSDPAHLSDVVRTDLAALRAYLPRGVAGLDVCHLQCHIGTDTVSLARAGAHVVGVDFSEPALAAAAALAASAGVSAEWVHTDVLDARAAVDAQLGSDRVFDLVYTSIGTICWLKDLDRWARQIEALLRPGGLFYIRDGHPALHSLDEDAEGLVTRHRYFADGRAQMWDFPTSYVGSDELAHTRTLEYPHPISEIVTSVLSAGLELVGFDEGDTLPWQFSESMVELPDGDYAYPEPLRQCLPMTFTLVARKR